MLATSPYIKNILVSMERYWYELEKARGQQRPVPITRKAVLTMAAFEQEIGNEEPKAVAADLAALAKLARTAYAAALCEGHAARLRAAPPATPAPAPPPPLAPAPAPPPARAPAPAPPPAPATEKFETYSWDQTDKFVTLYVPVEGATAAETTHDVGDRSFALAHARAGKTRRLAVSNLCGPVDAARSKLVLKRDRIQLRLAKAAPGDVWSALDDTLDRRKADRDARLAHGDLKGASTQQLLADMYANASDEERASLLAAAAAGADKRRGRAGA